MSNERSIISSIYTRLSIDVAAVNLRHVRLDENDRYQEDINSGLNNCLSQEANLDQAARAFRQDVAMTVFDRGVGCYCSGRHLPQSGIIRKFRYSDSASR